MILILYPVQLSQKEEAGNILNQLHLATNLIYQKMLDLVLKESLKSNEDQLKQDNLFHGQYKKLIEQQNLVISKLKNEILEQKEEIERLNQLKVYSCKKIKMQDSFYQKAAYLIENLQMQSKFLTEQNEILSKHMQSVVFKHEIQVKDLRKQIQRLQYKYQKKEIPQLKMSEKCQQIFIKFIKNTLFSCQDEISAQNTDQLIQQQLQNHLQTTKSNLDQLTNLVANINIRFHQSKEYENILHQQQDIQLTDTQIQTI